MSKNEKSKIKVNGRPKMEDEKKKSSYIKFRVNEEEKSKFSNLKQRLAPYLSEAEFARAKILDENIVQYSIRDLPEEEKNMLSEIALLGNQFRMVASRINITLNQEMRFKEDSQTIREILNSSYRKVLEFQTKELYYVKIGGILEKFNQIISGRDKYQNGDFLVNDIALVVKDLNEIYLSISSHQK